MRGSTIETLCRGNQERLINESSVDSSMNSVTITGSLLRHSEPDDTMDAIERGFFSRDPLIVARDLLGKKLVREETGRILSGMIIETEAYLGFVDSASHAFRGRTPRTPRNAVLFGPPGRAYVYFVYGMHTMLNVVTGGEGTPCAVLVRGLLPLQGLDVMEARRGKKGKRLTDGPAKLCQALAIDRDLNGWDLTRGERLWLEEYRRFPGGSIFRGPRIGIDYARPEDQSAPRRFWIEPAGNPCE